MQCRFSPLIGLPGGRLGRAWVEASVEESGLWSIRMCDECSHEI